MQKQTSLTASASLAALFVAIENGASFADIIAFIDQHYRYRPMAFINGDVVNAAGDNESSCKVFAFAKLHGLSQLDTLKLFCQHYQEILATPNADNHPNIRNFRYWGWQAFSMPQNPLTPKNASHRTMVK